MDGLPWPTITAASGGWALAGYFVWLLFTGRVITRREADGDRTRAEKAEENVKDLTQALAGMTALGQLQKALVVAKRQAAEVEDSIDVMGAEQ